MAEVPFCFYVSIFISLANRNTIRSLLYPVMLSTDSASNHYW